MWLNIFYLFYNIKRDNLLIIYFWRVLCLRRSFSWCSESFVVFGWAVGVKIFDTKVFLELEFDIVMDCKIRFINNRKRWRSRRLHHAIMFRKWIWDKHVFCTAKTISRVAEKFLFSVWWKREFFLSRLTYIYTVLK